MTSRCERCRHRCCTRRCRGLEPERRVPPRCRLRPCALCVPVRSRPRDGGRRRGSSRRRPRPACAIDRWQIARAHGAGPGVILCRVGVTPPISPGNGSYGRLVPRLVPRTGVGGSRPPRASSEERRGWGTGVPAGVGCPGRTVGTPGGSPSARLPPIYTHGHRYRPDFDNRTRAVGIPPRGSARPAWRVVPGWTRGCPHPADARSGGGNAPRYVATTAPMGERPPVGVRDRAPLTPVTSPVRWAGVPVPGAIRWVPEGAGQTSAANGARASRTDHGRVAPRETRATREGRRPPGRRAQLGSHVAQARPCGWPLFAPFPSSVMGPDLPRGRTVPITAG